MREDAVVVGDVRIPEEHLVDVIFDEDLEYIEERELLVNDSDLVIDRKTVV